MRRLLSVLSLIVVLAVPAAAQSIATAPPPAHTVELAGPRVGFTFLTGDIVDKLAERNIHVGPTISQFGWQVERQFYTRTGAVTALHEWVMLVGGLEQGVAIPSVSWMVGLRTREGTEFGFGPNLTPAGVALAFSAGMTLRAGVINVPMNVAVVPTKAGVRVSVLTGFTLRR